MFPFVPILQDGESVFSMFSNLQIKYDWVLDQLGYDMPNNLIDVLDKAVINPALEKRHELELRKAQTKPMRHVSDYRKHPGGLKSDSQFRNALNSIPVTILVSSPCRRATRNTAWSSPI